MNKFQTNDNKITRTDLKGISEAIKEIEEKILRLKIKTKEHI
jgi:hypothetical protein